MTYCWAQCAWPSLIGNLGFRGKEIRKELFFFFFLKCVNKHLFNIYYEPDTIQVSVETLMNKIGLAPVPKSEDAVIRAQRRDDVLSPPLLDCYLRSKTI